jgi:hypothetical protein
MVEILTDDLVTLIITIVILGLVIKILSKVNVG